MQKINFSEEAGHTSKRNEALYLEREDVNGDRGTPVIVEAVPIEVPLSLSLNCGQIFFLGL